MSLQERIERDERLRKKRWDKRQKRAGKNHGYRPSHFVRGEKSALLDFLRENSQGRDLSERRAFDGAWILRIPRIFSFIENPDETLDTIHSLIAISKRRNVPSLVFDHSGCEAMDIAASALLDVIALEIRKEWRSMGSGKYLAGLYPTNQSVRDVIQCMGITKHLQVRGHEAAPEVAESFVRFDLFEGRRASGLKLHSSDDQEIAATKLVRYFDECLQRIANFRLSLAGQRSIVKWAGEVITNAEEHSGRNEWYAIGYMVPTDVSHTENPQEKGKIGQCRLAIFNFGKSISESLQNPHISGETQRAIQELSKKHMERKFFGRAHKYNPNDLWTLYALQDGVSRFSATPGGSDRGKGTVEMIEAFQALGQSKSESCKPAMSLVSGTSRILFDGKYHLKDELVDGGSRMVLAFNEQNSLAEKPDSVNVHSLEGRFPGTILTFKFYLDSRCLEEIKNR